MKNDKFYSELAGIVKYHRKKSGLTQIQLAELAAVGKSGIFDIEHKKKTVQLKTLIDVLNVLNIKLDMISPLMEHYQKNREDTHKYRE